MYHELRLEHIVATAEKLQQRIAERFPDSGLSQIASQLVRIAQETGPVLTQMRRPHRIVQTAVVVESAIQDIVFISVALYFLLTLETRLDRRVSIRELQRLRNIVHIIDMHQLTKDPENLAASLSNKIWQKIVIIDAERRAANALQQT